MIFADRSDAGRRLAAKLGRFAGQGDAVVWGLPRGGVVVALEVARALHAPLEVAVVRKLGVPGQPELAMGAVAAGGVRVLNDEIVTVLRIDAATVEEITQRELRELERMQQAFAVEAQGSDPLRLDVGGKTLILVDDGLATGATMRAVVKAARLRTPARMVVAVPVAPPDTRLAFRGWVDDVICVATPEPFYGVGAWYREFRQTTDAEVRDALEQARAWSAPSD